MEGLGSIRWTKSFGWICAHVNHNKFFGGYKVIDENYLKLLLRLSPEGFKKAIDTVYFQKFEFGKTWVETEVTSEEELEQVWPTIVAAFEFVKRLNLTNKVAQPKLR